MDQRTINLAKKAMNKKGIKSNPAKQKKKKINKTTSPPENILRPQSPRMWIQFVFKTRNINEKVLDVEGSWIVKLPKKPKTPAKYIVTTKSHSEAVKIQDKHIKESGYTYKELIEGLEGKNKEKAKFKAKHKKVFNLI